MTYTLKYDGKEKQFQSFDELYSFFDWYVKDIDGARVYMNGKNLGSPTNAYRVINNR